MHVNACANGGGGTVTLPTCDYEDGNPNGALWSSGNKICIASTDEIRVIGQGQTLTKIGYADGATSGYGSIACPEGNGNVVADMPGERKALNITVRLQ
jgi:hypothetical protein